MCELSQLTMFYKINRNWGLLFPIAGKHNYSEYIVSYSYNVAGNGERDMHSEMDVSNGKKICDRSYVEMLRDMSCGKD